MRTDKKIKLEKRRHWRVRRKVTGTKDRPRMSVAFTNQHIYVQFIDDTAGVTLAAATTRGKAGEGKDRLAANVAGAKLLGRQAAETALAKGIKQVVFDRGGARYHWSKSKGKDGKPVTVSGKLATLAGAAREAGLKF
jgi:large subunit ribosomal protein L18